MPRPAVRHAVILGLLTAVGPFAIDMYLPALPAIGRGFGVGTDAVQASLTAYLIALGVGQLISGPLSDAFGRKPPLYLGLAVFLAASVGCAIAPNMATLIALRFVEGLGACAIMVIPRAVVRDLYRGAEAARQMSLLMTIYSISPILAPLLGSFLAATFGWRGVFWGIAALSALGVAFVRFALPETLPPERRRPSGVSTALVGYRALLADRHFLALAFIASMTLSGFFIYVANSSFILTTHYGVSPSRYALLFALNAISFVGVSQANGWLGARFGLRTVTRFAIFGYFVVMSALFLLFLAGVDRLDVLVAFLFVGFGLTGLIVPSTFVLAMESRPSLAGSASALIGTLNFAGGAVVVALVGLFADGGPLPMLGGVAGCSLLVCALGLSALGRRNITDLAVE